MISVPKNSMKGSAEKILKHITHIFLILPTKYYKIDHFETNIE